MKTITKRTLLNQQFIIYRMNLRKCHGTKTKRRIIIIIYHILYYTVCFKRIHYYYLYTLQKYHIIICVGIIQYFVHTRHIFQ
jgi:hypothetical protein